MPVMDSNREPKFSSSKSNQACTAASEKMMALKQNGDEEVLMRARRMENFESYCISLGVGPLWWS